MKLYHAVQLHNFELRHSWQVASILQQRSFDADLFLDVAVVAGVDNDLRVSPFRSGRTKLDYHETPRETFARRGLTRNQQLVRARRAGADWIFFADADHLYHPEFFRRLAEWLRENPAEKRVVSGLKKITTRLRPTDRLMLQCRDEWPHPRAFGRAAALPTRNKPQRHVAGGAMQVASLAVIGSKKKFPGLYVPEDCRADRHLFRKYQRARSDLVFRRSMAGSLMLADLPAQLHLEHRRDKEHGGKRHLEVQR